MDELSFVNNSNLTFLHNLVSWWLDFHVSSAQTCSHTATARRSTSRLPTSSCSEAHQLSVCSCYTIMWCCDTLFVCVNVWYNSFRCNTFVKPLLYSILMSIFISVDVLNQYRSIARQYSYFYKLFHVSLTIQQHHTESDTNRMRTLCMYVYWYYTQEQANSVKLPFDLFTYDDYR